MMAMSHTHGAGAFAPRPAAVSRTPVLSSMFPHTRTFAPACHEGRARRPPNCRSRQPVTSANLGLDSRIMSASRAHIRRRTAGAFLPSPRHHGPTIWFLLCPFKLVLATGLRHQWPQTSRFGPRYHCSQFLGRLQPHSGSFSGNRRARFIGVLHRASRTVCRKPDFHTPASRRDAARVSQLPDIFFMKMFSPRQPSHDRVELHVRHKAPFFPLPGSKVSVSGVHIRISAPALPGSRRPEPRHARRNHRHTQAVPAHQRPACARVGNTILSAAPSPPPATLFPAPLMPSAMIGKLPPCRPGNRTSSAPPGQYDNPHGFVGIDLFSRRDQPRRNTRVVQCCVSSCLSRTRRHMATPIDRFERLFMAVGHCWNPVLLVITFTMPAARHLNVSGPQRCPLRCEPPPMRCTFGRAVI